jgi:hypothetical protein
MTGSGSGEGEGSVSGPGRERAGTDARASQSSEQPRKDFADWLEPWCAGFIACRDGLTDADGEAFLQAAWNGYQRSGSQRAYRVNDDAPDPTEGLPQDLARVLRDQSIIVPQDAAVFEMIARWSNAPSDTASA